MQLVDGSSYTLAAQTTLVVRRTNQFVLYTRVNQPQLVALWVEWEVLELTAAAVQTHQVTGLTVNRCKLVHDTTVNAQILVLCSLTYLSQSHLVDLVVAEHVVQSESINAF